MTHFHFNWKLSYSLSDSSLGSCAHTHAYTRTRMHMHTHAHVACTHKLTRTHIYDASLSGRTCLAVIGHPRHWQLLAVKNQQKEKNAFKGTLPYSMHPHIPQYEFYVTKWKHWVSWVQRYAILSICQNLNYYTTSLLKPRYLFHWKTSTSMTIFRCGYASL